VSLAYRATAEDQLAAALDTATAHLACCPACSRLRALVSPDAACTIAQQLIRACMTADQNARQEDTP
jgi:UDP:flavonoid glycosyltransferase YjiC (YdhE family)